MKCFVVKFKILQDAFTNSIDKDYIDRCLSDSTILEKLCQKGLHTRRDQFLALLEDCGQYLPTVDGHLKEAVLLAKLMYHNTSPVFGYTYNDIGGHNFLQSAENQLNRLLDERYFDSVSRTISTRCGLFHNEAIHVAKTQYIDMVTSTSDPVLREKRSICRSIFYPRHDKTSALWMDSKNPYRAPPLARELSHIKLQTVRYENLELLDKTELSNEVVLQNHRKDTNLSAEETLHLRLINVDEKDAPWRMLSFLEEHFHAFQEKGVQTLLVSYLYHPSITQIMQEQPLFIDKLIQQTLRAYEQYEQDGDVETAAFMMHYLKRVEGRYEEIFGNTTPFNRIAYRDKLLALHPLVKTNAQNQTLSIALGLLHYQKSLYLGKSFTENLALEILQATYALQHRFESKEDEHQHRLYRQEIQYLQVLYREEIADFLNKKNPDSRDVFLNKLMGRPAKEKRWEGSYPDYTSNEYHYNVVRGEMTRNGFIIKEQHPISPEILHKHGLPKETRMETDGAYYSPDRNKRIWKPIGERDQDKGVVCEYYINQKWHTWHGADSCEILNFALTEEGNFVHSQGLVNVAGYYSYKKDTFSNRMIILSDLQRNPLYEAHYNGHEVMRQREGYVQYSIEGSISKIVRVIGDKKYSLANPRSAEEDAGFRLLKFLRSSIQVSLWQGGEDDDRVLDINNGLLSFNKKGKHYECVQYPGYYLAAPKEETLSGFIDYIHLIHETSGKEKIFFFPPKKRVVDSKDKEEVNFFLPLVFDSRMEVFYLDKDGMPIIKSSKDGLSLGYVVLMARNYEKAAHYLSRAEEMGKSDSASQEILRSIIRLSDNHPDAVNCKMQAACLLKKNVLLYEQRREQSEKELIADELFPSELYKDYLTTYGKGHLSSISLSIEKLLWKNLSLKFLAKITQGHPLLERRRQQILQGASLNKVDPIQREKQEKPLFSKDIQYNAFSEIGDFIPPSAYHLLSQELQEQKKKDLIPDRKLLPFLGAGKSFRTHFLGFYQDAKNGSKELLERLVMMRGESDETNRYLAWMLEQVMARRARCPSIPPLQGSHATICDDLSALFRTIRSKISSPPTGVPLIQQIVAIAKMILQVALSKMPLKIQSAIHLFGDQLNAFVKKVKEIFFKPKLHTFIKELQSEVSGKSRTHQYRLQSSHSEAVMPLSLTKELLYKERIEDITHALADQLRDKLKAADSEMRILEKAALQLVAKLPQDSKGANLILMKRLAGHESVLTMEDLMGLFVIGQQTPYLEETYLTQAGIAELENCVGRYLQQKILKDHAQACLDVYSEYAIATEEADQIYLRLKLLGLVNEKPSYEPRDRREYLVFEAMTGLRLRPEQIKNLEHLSSEDRAFTVFHMIMGAGKSTVITPIAAFLMARQGRLPMIVVPDSLYQTGKETTKLTVYQSFGRHAHPFEMQRDSDFSKEKLQTILDSLHRWKEEKGFIYTTRESLLSFLLKAKELFYQYEETRGIEAKQELQESIELSWKILQELKLNAAALFDEAHSLLNPRDELNFTFGRSKHIERSEAEAIYEILGFLAQDPSMKAIIDLENNNQAKMSPEIYLNEVKPILVKRLSDRYNIPQEYFNDALASIPAALEHHPQRDLIALSKVVVSTFLPHTLAKKRDEHYGLGSHNNYCIPYVGNNTPNEKAEFASYIETALYTGYYYLQQGLTPEQLTSFKADCWFKCQQEQMTSKILTSETKINAFFKKVTGQDLSRSFDAVKAQQHLKTHPEAIFEYCVEKVLPEVTIFPSKLSANPHHLTMLFEHSDAMTGTPWNKDAYPSQFKTAEEKAIDQKSVQIVQRIGFHDLISLDARQDDLVFQEIIRAFREKPDCRALIDAGALIKGVSNEGVAKALLAASDAQNIDGIAYYDESNELKILERVSGISILFKDSSIPKERRATFYDQRHTLGSDITQKRDANALVTLSETLKKFELFQAIWRMREIDKGQTLSLLIPQSIAHLIASDKKMTTQKVLDFVSRNQEEQELFDNFRSRKLEIRAIVDEAIHDALMKAPDFGQRLAIFTKTRHLLMQALDIKPFEAFGGIDREEEAKKILQEYTKKWLSVLDDLKSRGALQDVTSYKAKITHLREIPLSPKYHVTENSTMGTQVENQVQMQVKLTVATKADTYREGIRPWAVWEWPQRLDIFKGNWMKPKSSIMPICLARDIIQRAHHPKVAQMKGVFNDTFLISNNFLPQKTQSWREIHAEPFAWYAKPVYHLVVAEEADGTIKTLMIDQNDVVFFRDKLLKDQGNGLRKICIYDPTIGIVLQGKKTFDEKALKTHPAFIKHLVYAKFWNGVSKYTAEEASYLETWIQSQGVQKMYDFFQEIVRNKEDSAKAFTHSILENIFAKLLA